MEIKKQINLGEDKVSKIFWKYAIPSIIAMLAQTTASFIDSIFIGKFVGPEGLSAITLFFPCVSILIGIAAMFAIGSSTLAGIELGKGNQEKSNNYFNLAMLFLTGISIISTFIIITNMENITQVFHVTGITKQYIFDYGNTISYFFIFFLLNFALSFFLKLDGKPSVVVVVMLSGTLTNIVLDYLLIVVFKQGLVGAALATGLSQLIPWTILIITTLFKSSWKFKMPVVKFKEIYQILFNGSSELLSSTAHAIVGFVFNMLIIERFGVIGVAGYAVALQLASLAGSLGYSFGEANQTGVSFNIGANKLDRVRQFRSMTIKATLITGFILFMFTYFFGSSAASIFVKDPETIAIASYILKYYAFAFIVMLTNIATGTYYTAVNDPILSGGITFYRSLIGFIIGLVICPLIFGDNGIWMAILFAEYSTFMIGMVLYKKKPYGLNIKKIHKNEKLIA
ncbi:MAG: hypothetical protein JEZ08_04235 [Clostridiales bacterium]|nr:hypothetical protein [Clostridiales bacterium]